jgi:hypothetical protein
MMRKGKAKSEGHTSRSLPTAFLFLWLLFWRGPIATKEDHDDGEDGGVLITLTERLGSARAFQINYVIITHGEPRVYY